MEIALFVVLSLLALGCVVAMAVMGIVKPTNKH